jgi:hypothetical protein
MVRRRFKGSRRNTWRPRVFEATGLRKGSNNWGFPGAGPRRSSPTRTGGKKLILTKEELRALHQAHGQQFGNEAQQAVDEARRQGKATEVGRTIGPSEAVAFAIRRLSEREAVFDHFQVARDALNYGQGHLRLKDVEANRAAGRFTSGI